MAFGPLEPGAKSEYNHRRFALPNRTSHFHALVPIRGSFWRSSPASPGHYKKAAMRLGSPSGISAPPNPRGLRHPKTNILCSSHRNSREVTIRELSKEKGRRSDINRGKSLIFNSFPLVRPRFNCRKVVQMKKRQDLCGKTQAVESAPTANQTQQGVIHHDTARARVARLRSAGVESL